MLKSLGCECYHRYLMQMESAMKLKNEATRHFYQLNYTASLNNLCGFWANIIRSRNLFQVFIGCWHKSRRTMAIKL